MLNVAPLDDELLDDELLDDDELLELEEALDDALEELLDEDPPVLPPQEMIAADSTDRLHAKNNLFMFVSHISVCWNFDIEQRHPRSQIPVFIDGRFIPDRLCFPVN